MQREGVPRIGGEHGDVPLYVLGVPPEPDDAETARRLVAEVASVMRGDGPSLHISVRELGADEVEREFHARRVDAVLMHVDEKTAMITEMLVTYQGRTIREALVLVRDPEEGRLRRFAVRLLR